MSSRSVFVMANIILQVEKTYRYYLFMVDAKELVDDFDKMQNGIVPALNFFKLLNKIRFYTNYRYQFIWRKYENNLSKITLKRLPVGDDESILENCKNSRENEFRDSISRDWKDYEENYLKGFINLDKMNEIALQRMEEDIERLWSEAVQSLEASDSKVLRLWKELFESEEGFDLLCKFNYIDGNALSDQDWASTSIKDSIITSRYPMSVIHNDSINTMHKLILRVPGRIAKDEEDLHELTRFARTMVFNLLGKVEYEENEYVLRPWKLAWISDSGNDSNSR